MRWSVAAALFALVGLAAGTARAAYEGDESDPFATGDAAEEQPAWSSARNGFIAELQAGAGGPLARWGIELGYTRNDLTLGLGIGINKEWSQQHSLPPLTLFGRWLPWQVGAFSLGMGASLARQFQSISEGPIGNFITSWDPGYRVDAAAVAMLAGELFYFRLEAGMGIFITSPTCNGGDCGAPSIPPEYRHMIPVGQIAPTMTAALGLRLGNAGTSAHSPTSSTDWPPHKWLHALLVGDASGLGVALATGYLLVLAGGGVDSQSAFGGPSVLTALVVAALAATTLGTSSGVFAVASSGEQSHGGFSQTFLGSLAGTALAVAGTALVYWATKSSFRHEEYSIASGLILFATLPAGCAAVGYQRSASARSPAVALLQLNSEEDRLVVGVPSLGIGKAASGATVNVGLLGGRF